MRRNQVILKRLFDIVFSIAGLLFTSWLIFIAFIASTIDTRANGFFTQVRVGRYGKCFKVIKIRTMRPQAGPGTTITCSDDPRISSLGKILRRLKIDELPQLINIFVGHMSFVGPRPDVPGYADELTGYDRIVLSVRPGLTGPATLKYRREENMLATTDNPEEYNRNVIFPDKVRINREYILNYHFWEDMKSIFKTIFSHR